MRPIAAVSVLLGLALTLTACTGVEAEPGSDEEVAVSEHGLSIYTDNPAGNLSQVSVDDGSWPNLVGHGVFKPVPGLSATVYSRSGDNLAITVSVELDAAQGVTLRAMVDGVAASPGQVTIKSGSTARDGVRSFTFVKPVVSGGQHLVVIEALVPDTGTFEVRRRSLSIQSAAAAWGSTRLSVAAGQTTITKNTSSWQDIPDLITYVYPTSKSQFAATFSGYVLPDSGTVRVRALIDGVAVGDTVVAQPGDATRLGARSATFTSSLAAGTHTVKLQWRVDGGSARIVGRSLAAEVSRADPRGGMFVSASEPRATSVSSTSWVALGSGISFVTTPGSSTAQLLWSGEVRLSGSGQLKTRLVVDGEPATFTELALAEGGGVWRTASASFVLDNLAPGSHTVSVQMAVGSSTSAWIGDRALRIVHKDRSGSDFAGLVDGVSPDHRSQNILVICMDPLRPGHLPPSAAQIRGHFEGSDGDLSLKGWLAENTGGHGKLGAVMYRGCDDGKWFRPPPEHQGTWYWDGAEEEDRFAIMRRDALAAADPSFDYHSFDFNNDDRLDADELVIYFTIPQSSAYGAYRGASAVLDGTQLSVRGVDTYLSSLASQRRNGVGILAHESSHAFFGAWDLYCGGGSPPWNPNRWSTMDAHGGATHLDPFHKLKMGFVTPDLVDIPRWYSASVSLADVETQREITLLYDPARDDREYFILEYRRTSASLYDSGAGADAVLVWHVFEDFELGYATRPPDADTYSCGEHATGVRLVARLRDGGVFLPSWSDGSSTAIRLEVLGPLTEPFAEVMIQHLP